MITNEEKKVDNLICLTDNNDNLININSKIYSLFNNFLIKESKFIYPKQNISLENEIMPEYQDIDIQIQKKINDIRRFYDSTPIFNEMKSKNSYTMNNFIKGFKELFFGSKGIVTRKSIDLKNYYKSFESKSNLNSKIYAGSLDYYDFLSNYNSFFERLKNSRKRILKINGNFTVTNTRLDKMHAIYTEYEKKRKKKTALLKGKKNYFNYFNDSNDNKIYNNTNLDINKNQTGIGQIGSKKDAIMNQLQWQLA